MGFFAHLAECFHFLQITRLFRYDLVCELKQIDLLVFRILVLLAYFRVRGCDAYFWLRLWVWDLYFGAWSLICVKLLLDLSLLLEVLGLWSLARTHFTQRRIVVWGWTRRTHLEVVFRLTDLGKIISASERSVLLDKVKRDDEVIVTLNYLIDI